MTTAEIEQTLAQFSENVTAVMQTVVTTLQKFDAQIRELQLENEVLKWQLELQRADRDE